MYRNIRCDRKSWKLFGFRNELNKASLFKDPFGLLTQPATSELPKRHKTNTQI